MALFEIKTIIKIEIKKKTKLEDDIFWQFINFYASYFIQTQNAETQFRKTSGFQSLKNSSWEEKCCI